MMMAAVRFSPRDIVAIILSISILLHPVLTLGLRFFLDAPLVDPAANTLEGIVVATLAVVAGYLARGGSGDRHYHPKDPFKKKD